MRFFLDLKMLLQMNVLSIRADLVSLTGVSCSYYRFFRRAHSTNTQLTKFWNQFYNSLTESDFNLINSNISIYQNDVILKLEENKLKFDELRKTDYKKYKEELYNFQKYIENYTMHFDENNLFKSSSTFFRLLVGTENITAKDYIKMCDLTEDELSYINSLGQYTLEAIIIHVLGSVFNPLKETSFVRVFFLK